MVQGVNIMKIKQNIITGTYYIYSERKNPVLSKTLTPKQKEFISMIRPKIERGFMIWER